MNNLGIIYEDIAVNYLKKKKYKILERNFTTKVGEIDIICFKNNCLIFIEVKGGNDKFSNPAFRVNKKKLQKISKVGEIYINKNINIQFEEVQIDVISINNKNEISHYKSQRW